MAEEPKKKLRHSWRFVCVRCGTADVLMAPLQTGTALDTWVSASIALGRAGWRLFQRDRDANGHGTGGYSLHCDKCLPADAA